MCPTGVEMTFTRKVLRNTQAVATRNQADFGDRIRVLRTQSLEAIPRNAQARNAEGC
jgi:hypothetical protein